jgi:erythritol transport system ATP-binding protein
VAEIDIPWIIDQMVGRSGVAERREAAGRKGAEVLRVERLGLAGAGTKRLVDDVSFTISAGEVVCFYGLMGAGRSELFESLFGLRQAATGRIWLGERELSRLTLRERIRAGVFLVPEDRQRDGLLPNLSVTRNLSISSLWQLRRLWSVDRKKERDLAASTVERLRIKIASPEVSITSLSGGNQQKVVIGKSLLTAPRMLLLDDPTRGIDIGAKAEVFRTMRQLADGGLGVAFATSDLKEALTNADRIIVMSQGRITADLLRDGATEEALVAASTPGHAPRPTVRGATSPHPEA